jgi:BirA family biotin operon repressor/biotin-[acetyl-CoA-carboxylase] ligase
MTPNDDLSQYALLAELTTTWLGRSYHYLESLDSTNDKLKAWAAAGYPAGTVLLADYQTAGRGRLDRRWEAPPASSLLFSTLLRPGWPARQGGWLTMLGGLAVAETIEAITGLSARLKWPNDVVLEDEYLEDEYLKDEFAETTGAWRKVGGLLLDGALDAAGRLESVILGIGLNVNVPATALPRTATPATSLLAAAGRPFPRRPLLLALLARLEARYDAAMGGVSPWAEWNERLVTIGRNVRVAAIGQAQTLDGRAEGTDEWGQLLVRDAAGRLHTVAAGDVTLRED